MARRQRYEVTVTLTRSVQLDRVYAEDEREARAKAEEIVAAWEGVVVAEAEDVEEINE